MSGWVTLFRLKSEPLCRLLHASESVLAPPRSKTHVTAAHVLAVTGSIHSEDCRFCPGSARRRQSRSGASGGSAEPVFNPQIRLSKGWGAILSSNLKIVASSTRRYSPAKLEVLLASSLFSH